MNKKYQTIIIPEYEAVNNIEKFEDILYDDSYDLINVENYKTFDLNKNKFHFKINFKNRFKLVKKINETIYIQQILIFDKNYICDDTLKANNVSYDEHKDDNFIGDNENITVIELIINDDTVITDENDNIIENVFEYDYPEYNCYWTKGAFYVEDLNLRIIKVNDKIYEKQKTEILKFNDNDWNEISFILGCADNMYCIYRDFFNGDLLTKLRNYIIEMIKYIYNLNAPQNVKIFMYEYILEYLNMIEDWHDIQLYFVHTEINEETEKYFVEWCKYLLNPNGKYRYDLKYLYEDNIHLFTKPSREIINELINTHSHKKSI